MTGKLGSNRAEPGQKSTSDTAAAAEQLHLTYCIVIGLFLLSGFSSLVYQVVWTRELVFVFGSTTFASATVLSVFMGGLALGSFVAGRFSDRLSIGKALLWYGVLEGIIGGWALVVPFLFHEAIPLYRVIWQQFHLSVMPFSLLRFTAAAVILLPPTACMGATLPLLSRFVVGSLSYVGRRVGTLYAINTLGAVSGSMLSGFLLLPSFGLTATNIFSATVNFALLVVVVLLVSKLPADQTATTKQQPSSEAGSPSDSTDRPVSTAETVVNTNEAEPSTSIASDNSSGTTELDQPAGVQTKKSLKKERRRQKKAEAMQQQRYSGALPKTDLLTEAATAAQTEIQSTAQDLPAEIPSELVPEPSVPATIKPHVVGAVSTTVATIAFGASGAIAMMYEVAWTRALLMIVGSTTYAFTCMLSSFLIGIFLGSWYASRHVDRMKHALPWFAACQLVLGAVGLAVLFGFNYVPYLSVVVTAQEWGNHELAQFARFALSGLVLLPISLFFGATFPLVVKACATDLTAVGKSVGTLYSANTLGAIVGAFVSGFVVVPCIGVEKTLVLCAGGSILIGLFVLTVAQNKVPKVALAAVMAITVGITGWAIQSSTTKVWDQLALLDIQTLRRTFRWKGVSEQVPPYPEWLSKLHSTIKLLCYYDGACGTAGVYEASRNHWRSLLTNGHVDASYGDQHTQVLLAALPLAVYPQARDICVVGWGSGVTVGVAGKWKNANVTAIEIEPVVVDASRYFSKINYEPYNNKQIGLEKNDGRNYLLATDRKFDLIISEPSNPWQSGVCNLFTKEFFESSKRSLRPDGVFSLWLQINEISPKNVLRILSALHSVYPYVMPMQTKLGDFAVLASARPIQIGRNNVNLVLKDAVMGPILSTVGIKSAHDVVARVVATPAAMSALVKDTEPNSDDLNHLEYEVSKTYETTSYHPQNEAMFNRNAGKLWECINWENAPPQQQAFTCANIGISCVNMDTPVRAGVWSNHSNSIELNPAALAAMATAERDMGHFEKSKEHFKQALELDPVRPYTLVRYMHLCRHMGDLMGMRKTAERLCVVEPNEQAWKYELARTYLPSLKMADDGPLQGVDEPDKAKPLLQELVKNDKFSREEPFIMALWALVCHDFGNDPEAIAYMQRYLNLRPENFYCLTKMAQWYHAQGNQKESSRYEQLAKAASEGRRQHLVESAATDIDRAFPESAIVEISQALDLGPCPKVIPLLERLKADNPKAEALLKRAKATR
jgi:spermidine synthase/MFS family permease/tetratricopeptide (TPR) repeat protein